MPHSYRYQLQRDFYEKDGAKIDEVICSKSIPYQSLKDLRTGACIISNHPAN